MTDTLRTEFVKLHKKDMLKDLLGQWQKQFPDAKFPDLPERGNLDLDEVLKSPYFFS